jgi:hypothetical protein
VGACDGLGDGAGLSVGNELGAIVIRSGSFVGASEGLGLGAGDSVGNSDGMVSLSSSLFDREVVAFGNMSSSLA